MGRKEQFLGGAVSMLFATGSITLLSAVKAEAEDVLAVKTTQTTLPEITETAIPPLPPQPPTLNSQYNEAAILLGNFLENITPPPIPIPWLPETVQLWGTLIIEKTHLCSPIPEFPSFAALIALYESAGDPEASSGVAFGLFQLFPPTAESLAKGKFPTPLNLFDVNINTELGVCHLADLVQKYGGTLSDETIAQVITIYHGLPLGERGKMYIDFILRMWHERDLPQSPTYEEWLARDNYEGLRFVEKARQSLQTKGLL